MSGSQDVQLKILPSGTHCFKHVPESINTVLITWVVKLTLPQLSFALMVSFGCRSLFTPTATFHGPLWDSRPIRDQPRKEDPFAPLP